MTELSSQARAVIDAVLQFKFGEEANETDYPRMSRIIGPELAAALLAAAGIRLTFSTPSQLLSRLLLLEAAHAVDPSTFAF
jgi:hypothetical protein